MLCVAESAAMQSGSPDAVLAAIAQSSNEVTQGWMRLLASAPASAGAAPWLADLQRNSAKLGAMQAAYFEQQSKLWSGLLAGQPASLADPAPGDRRFSAKEWRDNAYYDYLRQSYLLASRYLEELVEVAARPLLIVPPCINKYYVLDLQPENSFVAHAVASGNTVFMLSWRNAGPEISHLTWDDYLDKGVLTASRAAREICGSDRVNALGFCVGGTLLGAALAVLAAKGDDAVASATLLTTMLDFTEAGPLGVFVDEASVRAREAAIGERGILPGSDLAFVFSSLRANDLVWPYVVNNYLLGGRPAAFDLLFWNSDSANLPGPMYCYYVRNTYLENRLKQPGALVNCGVPVDLGKVKLPVFVLSTREDHIVPWRSAYRTLSLLGEEKTFVLGASGHIAGIVNPPAKKRRSYWVGEPYPDDPDAWLEHAREERGSWWPRWSEWLARHAGGTRPAPTAPGSARYKPIEPAPGRYVKQKAN